MSRKEFEHSTSEKTGGLASWNGNSEYPHSREVCRGSSLTLLLPSDGLPICLTSFAKHWLLGQSSTVPLVIGIVGGTLHELNQSNCLQTDWFLPRCCVGCPLCSLYEGAIFLYS